MTGLTTQAIRQDMWRQSAVEELTMDLHAGLELFGGAALGLAVAALPDDQLAPLLLALPRKRASLQT